MFERKVMDDIRGLREWYRSLSWLKKRLFWVMIILIPVWGSTFYAFYYIIHNNMEELSDLIVEITVAWSGELLFFTIVGLIVTFVTLRDPGEGSLDERIRILFGSDKIPDCVLTYNKNTLSRLAAYAETATRTVLVKQFDPAIHAYRVEVTTTYLYRNLLRDLPYDETLPLRVKPDVFSGQQPPELGKVTSITVDGQETMTGQLPIEADGFQTELRL